MSGESGANPKDRRGILSKCFEFVGGRGNIIFEYHSRGAALEQMRLLDALCHLGQHLYSGCGAINGGYAFAGKRMVGRPIARLERQVFGSSPQPAGSRPAESAFRTPNQSQGSLEVRGMVWYWLLGTAEASQR